MPDEIIPARPPDSSAGSPTHITGGTVKPSNTASGAIREKKGGAADRGVGKVLRSAYQSMVEESIPDEMLNLLNRLD